MYLGVGHHSMPIGDAYTYYIYIDGHGKVLIGSRHADSREQLVRILAPAFQHPPSSLMG